MPPSPNHTPLSIDALNTALRATDPAALLVAPWLLHKVLAQDSTLGAAVFTTPRIPAHVIDRQRLLDLAAREELPLDPAPPDLSPLVLLARPDPDILSATPAQTLLQRYWRLLFHARARAAVAATLAADPDPRAAVQRRIERLGRTAFNEARFVLQREKYIPVTADDAQAYAEFAALYLAFTRFNPQPLAAFFSSITDPVPVLTLLAQDLDSDTLFRATRPAGADDPLAHYSPAADHPPVPIHPSRRARRDALSKDKLLARAAEADTLGNDVRAAILRMRVYRAGKATAGTVYTDALRDIDQLVARLAKALQLDDNTARQWRTCLTALLENAAGGWWNAEGRLLYDLQKVCVYHEREIFSLNVVDHVLEWFRRPLRRPQPGQRLVLALKALRTAFRRASRARLNPHARSELRRLLDHAIEQAAQRVRDYFRPGVASAIEEGGLRPRNSVEAVAHAKLIDESLDHIVDRGYFSFGALRDVVSRNQMKLNDLATRDDFIHGDALLRIDKKIEDNLDYVYHRGELYLRGFHRLSSLLFATIIGRILTRWFILPFGGALLILEGLDHSVGKLFHKIKKITPGLDPDGEFAGSGAAMSEPPPIFNRWWLLLLTAFFLLALINSPPFRALVARFFRAAGKILRALFIDFPKYLATRPLVRAFFSSHFVSLFTRYVIKPLLFAGIAYILVPNTASRRAHMLTLAGAFFGINLLLNSRIGRAFEQTLLHTLRTTFARFTWDILVALFRVVVNLFQRFLELIDRLLYAVDELLRFRAGQGRFAFLSKAILGVFWFYIAYVTRFVINLLVEPQINPIKHFPVVTVSHKLLFPTIPYLANLFMTFRIDKAAAYTYATGVIWCIPGIFGFLAWEFKSNWKLYRANRSRDLKPVRAGSHGETLAQLLRPGFHSGTLPKIFHKLRRAQLKDDPSPTAIQKHLHAAEHVKDALENFFNREFLALLNRHPLFADAPITLSSLDIATTLIRARLACPAVSSAPAAITFEQRSGWIIACLEPGWIADLSPEQSNLFAAALQGLYKMAAVDLIDQQIRALFPQHPDLRYDLRRNQLIVWPTPDYTIEAAYTIQTDRLLSPRFTTPTATPLPSLAPTDLLLRKSQVRRASWIAIWDPVITSTVIKTLSYANPTTPLPQPAIPALPPITVLPPLEKSSPPTELTPPGIQPHVFHPL